MYDVKYTIVLFLGMDGNWNWTDGSRSIYTNWDNVVDDENEEGHDCVYIDKEEGKWKDEKCTDKKYYMCKKKLERKYTIKHENTFIGKTILHVSI